VGGVGFGWRVCESSRRKYINISQIGYVKVEFHLFTYWDIHTVHTVKWQKFPYPA